MTIFAGRILTNNKIKIQVQIIADIGIPSDLIVLRRGLPQRRLGNEVWRRRLHQDGERLRRHVLLGVLRHRPELSHLRLQSLQLELVVLSRVFLVNWVYELYYTDGALIHF